MIVSHTFSTPKESARLLTSLAASGLYTSEGLFQHVYENPEEFFDSDSRVIVKHQCSRMIGVLHVARGGFYSAEVEALYGRYCYGHLGVYTDESYRRQGLGSMLLAQLFLDYPGDHFVVGMRVKRLVPPTHRDRAHEWIGFYPDRGARQKSTQSSPPAAMAFAARAAKSQHIRDQLIRSNEK